ncbi:hypothetical protein [Nitrososphaera sp.]|uniref:hypothetical protein n=1 Tax=Nitrososphaera sp. TaxID=1971748 RepID=UPI002ED920A2
MARGENNKKPYSIGRLYAVATLLAAIIAVPAVSVAMLAHFVFETDMVITLASSLITLFVAMGVGIKVSKRFAREKGSE